MSSANTFGTFLDTVRKLEQGPQGPGVRGWPEKAVFQIAKTLLSSDGTQPVRATMGSSGLPQDEFLGALVAGRDKGIFEVDETADEPVLRLTKLGRTLVS
jgi:hypothetical protein